jgi:fructose-specific phosphotransferase system component IIB
MQQPNFISLQGENHLKKKAPQGNLTEADMQTTFKAFDNKMQNSRRYNFKDSVRSTVEDGIAQGKSEINNEKEQIKNAGENIRKKEGERAKKGAIRSIWDIRFKEPDENK